MTSAGINLAGGLLEHALAVLRGLELGRAGGRQLDQLVVEERDPALEAPRHRHVVDAFDRVVDQHHGGVQAQRAVDAGLRARAREVLGDELLAGIIGGRETGRDECLIRRLVAVEERPAVAGQRAVQRRGLGPAHRGIPVITGEHLVGALAGLHDLDVFGHFLGQQIEGDAVVADHRLAHGADRTVEGGQHAVGADADLMVVGAESLGDEVGVFELVALDASDGFEADGERGQPVLAGLGEEPDDQAGVDAAGEQAAHRHVGDEASFDREAQRGQNRVLPIAFGPVCPFVATAEVGRPVGRGGGRTVGLDRDERRGRYLAHPAQDRVRRRHHGMEGEVVVQRDGVDAGVDAAAGQQRGQGRGEADAVCDPR